MLLQVSGSQSFAPKLRTELLNVTKAFFQSLCLYEIIFVFVIILFRFPAKFNVFTLNTGSPYILPKYSFTSCLVILGRILNVAFAKGEALVGSVADKRVKGICGRNILKEPLLLRGPNILDTFVRNISSFSLSQ